MHAAMLTQFVQHILSFFNQSTNKEHGAPAPGAPDLPVLHDLLQAAGFSLKFWDKSDYGGVSHGCRVIIVCQRSGTRVVMDSQGACTCPPEEDMKRLLDAHRKVTSEPASPTPSVSGALNLASEDSTTTSTCHTVVEAAGPGQTESVTETEAVPVLSRQNTWSRDEAAEGRRLSAPQSAWTSITGDELNVMAATDLLNEALSLLTGVKKMNLRNTPIGPSRGAAVRRRVSGDALSMPAPGRPSRHSTGSSGLASLVSSRSTSTSSLSVKSDIALQGDTPRPVRPAGPALRRTSSLRASTASSAARVAARTSSTKGPDTSTSAQANGGKKLPSFLRNLSSDMKSSQRRLIPPKVKTNLTPTAGKAAQPNNSVSPDIQSAKL